MGAEYDATEFVDADFQAHKAKGSSPAGAASRAPTREENEFRISDLQRKLGDLNRSKDELERERASLEEVRRRQVEFQTGRQEMVQHLTRGIGLLEKAEFDSRRSAEQMAKTLADFRESLSKVQLIKEETWAAERSNVELTRALTAIENARMEWNAARLKFDVLDGTKSEGSGANGSSDAPLFTNRSLAEMCKIGLAMTWPIAAVGVLALIVLLILLLSH